MNRFQGAVQAAIGDRPASRVAREAGLPQDAILRVLRGHDPRLSRASAVAEALDLDFRIGRTPKIEEEKEPPPGWAAEIWEDLRTEIADLRKVILHAEPTPVDDRVDEERRRREDEARNRQQLEAVLQGRDQELDRLRAQAAAPAKLPDPDVSPIQSAPGWRDEDFESVRRYESEDVRLAAGTGTFADQEPVAGEVKFRTSWLRKRRLRAKDLFLVDVSGDSMEPTICDGDSALVDETHRSPRSGKIYALQAGDGPLVKRLRKRDHRWWADSDNDEYEPQPLDDRARIMGRVVWWAHTD